MRKVGLLSFLLIYLCFEVSSQSSDTIVYAYPSTPALFFGGQSSLLEKIRNQIVYSNIPGFAEFKGRVKITFIVEKNGCTSFIQTIPIAFEPEIERLFASFPLWDAAEENKEKVRSTRSMSLYFNLH